MTIHYPTAHLPASAAAWLWLAILLLTVFCSPATAEAPALLVNPGERASLQGHIDFLPDNNTDPSALLQGKYDERFHRYDHPTFSFRTGPVWLRMRVVNNTPSESLVLTTNDVLYTDARLLYNKTSDTAAKDNSQPDVVDREAGFMHTSLTQDWPYYDIAWHLDIPPGETRTIYLHLGTTFELLLDLSVSDQQTYSVHQVRRASWGHLMVGLMIGVLIYLTMIAIYINSMMEVRHCIAFIAVSFTILLFGRGYLFYLMPEIHWLKLHVYTLLFSAQALTYVTFSRYYFRTQTDFTHMDLLLRVLAWLAALLFIASLFLPVPWGVTGVGIMAFVFVVLLCVCSVYVWANSERPLTIYVFGTLVFLFACILATAENAGLLFMGGHSRQAYEAGICLQAILFVLALSENIRGFQQQQTHLAVQAAAAKAENRAKSSFLAKMSHELRTPMNGLLGMLQLLERTPLNEQQQHYAAVMRNSGRMLLGVIDDVLDYSRIVAGKLQITEENFDLAQVMDEIEMMFAQPAKQKSLALRFSLNTGKPVVARGDALRLRQILVNLIGNAIKFTNQGVVSVRLWVEECDETHWVLHGEVEDTGIGITREQMPLLFREYSQADGAKSHGGSGLGLVICKQLTELMQGEITAESAPGYGSLFRFHIAVKPPGDGPLQTAPQDPAQNSLTRQTVRVLVVEDNDTNREVMVSLLAELGHQADCVANGAEALKVFCQLDAHWDLVLMDVEMPVLDGLAATQRLRAWEEKHCRNAVPVIALTGHDAHSHEDRIRQAGMDDHIVKPVELDRLHTVLARWLNNK